MENKKQDINPTMDHKILLGIVLFSFLYTIPEKFPKGKMGRKNSNKALKKQLKIFSTKNEKYYLKLIDEADKILNETREFFGNEELQFLNPAALFLILNQKYSELLDIYDFKPSWIENIKKDYLGTGDNTFISIKYTNKLIENILKYNPKDNSKEGD